MDKKEIIGLAATRTALIDKIIEELDAQVTSSQETLLRIIIDEFVDQLETDQGKILNSIKNKRLLTLIEQAYQRYANTAGLEVVKGIVDGVQKITDFNGGYFDPFAAPAQLVPIKKNVDSLIKTWLGIEPESGKVKVNGYLDVLVKDATVKNAIVDLAVRQISGGSGYKETKSAMKNFIVGEPGKTGALNKYYRNFVFDAFSQIDRATSQTYADELGLDFAIYEGGLIKTSRQFCKDHNGKVYTRAEIAEFDPGEANKQPGYNPFVDLGGFGCRHHLNWIPKALAVILRPDLATMAPAKQGTPAKAAPAKPAQPAAAPAPVKQAAPEPEKPKAKPTAVKSSNFNDVKTPKQFKERIGDVFTKAVGIAPVKVSLSSTLPFDTAIKYGNQLAALTEEYQPFKGIYKVEAISFKSSASSYGSVRYYTGSMLGRISNANFGDRWGKGDTRTYVKGATENRSKSRVDADKIELSTVTHEFAHFITGTEQTTELGKSKDARVEPFWKEIKALRSDYHKELLALNQAGDKAGVYELSLGKYASTNADEFWAEGFTEYKLSSTPSKYAKLIGKVVDKHFKR